MKLKRPSWLHGPRSRGGKIAAWIALAIFLLIVVWIVLHRLFKPKPKPPEPTAVTVAEAVSGSTPILLRGLGQVQAFNTFTARSRVDGNITRIGFREGSKVPAGALLVRVDPRSYQAALEQAQATRERDEAQLANARLDLRRYALLLPQGLTARQAYDTQVATVRQLAATVKSDAAQIETARVNLSYTDIRAPFAGRTGQRLVDIGNLVSAAGQTGLVVLTQTHPIFVSFALPELDLAQVVAAMHGGQVIVYAYDHDDQKRLATGVLQVLDNTVDQGSGTVRLKAVFENPGEMLWPGEFVNARVVIAVRAGGITLPAGAIQMGPNGRYVFRVKPDNKAEVVPVTVSQIEAGVALVDSGLRGGDRVVVDGAFGLSPGDAVRVSGKARIPVTQDTLDMTGRTGISAEAMQGGGSQGGGASNKGDKDAPQKTSKPLQPTQREAPQRQTPGGGGSLNGAEGAGAREPLPNARQVPEPPRARGEKPGQQQGAGSGG